MHASPNAKYRPFPPVDLPDRRWPSRVITQAPIWCSVDLRDGNQALAVPMRVEEKLEYFEMLARIGFKEIEVGFPSASQIEFDFVRRLIEERRVPEGVWLQVLCQCREDLIVRTLESLRGAERVIFHLYNSTSPAQRRHVFDASREQIRAIAEKGVALLRQHSAPLVSAGTRLRLEYSPESFTSTELDFALEVCEAVTDLWQPTVEDKIILNLPATVEYATPNVHADQIEWMCRHLTRRDRTLVSLHTHNDRGTGIAATELGLLAGADRVEGTLFGNGERTGNLDVVTVALNLHTHGIAPGLDFSNLPQIREVYERCTGMEVPPRAPYAGDLTFTAFSGSHQDAIRKSWAVQKPDQPWEVLYIPIDPADIGRTYRAIIRINSQSGKGGAAYVLEKEFGYELPKAMHPDLGRVIGQLADQRKTELSPQEVCDAFSAEFVNRADPLRLLHFRSSETEAGVECAVEVSLGGTSHQLAGRGNGPIAAFVHALSPLGLPGFELRSYHEHALGQGADSRAVSYIQIRTEHGRQSFGAGVDTSIELASIKGVVSAINRALARS